MRASEAVHSWESFGEDAWTAFQARWGSLLHAEFRSSSSRRSNILPPSRRCRVITGLAPLLETNLRAGPCEKRYATDASPSGAGGCVASITREAWPAFYELAEEKGEHVRLDWKGDEPPSSMRDGRAAAAPLASVLVDSREVLGAVSKGRSSSRKIVVVPRKLGFWCFAYDIALELVWVPT